MRRTLAPGDHPGQRPAPGSAADTIQRVTTADAGLPTNIGAPATRALSSAGYTELRQLSGVPVSELRKLHGVGPKALRLLQEALERQGLSLGLGPARDLMTTPEWDAVYTAAELAQLHGVGPKALRLLQEALQERGMSLG